jgi:hypothetical protein
LVPKREGATDFHDYLKIFAQELLKITLSNAFTKLAFIEMSAQLLREKIDQIKTERRIANEKHERETFIYKKSISEVTKKLFRAIHYLKVYSYFQLLQVGSDHVSPFVIQRQAILCAILHKEEILQRQNLLLHLHQEKFVEGINSFRTQIINEFSASIKNRSISIVTLKYEIHLLESIIQSDIDTCRPIEALSDNDGENGYFSEMFRNFNVTKRSKATAVQLNVSSCPSTPSKLRNPLLQDRERIGFIANVA